MPKHNPLVKIDRQAIESGLAVLRFSCGDTVDLRASAMPEEILTRAALEGLIANLTTAYSKHRDEPEKAFAAAAQRTAELMEGKWDRRPSKKSSRPPSAYHAACQVWGVEVDLGLDRKARAAFVSSVQRNPETAAAFARIWYGPVS